MWKDAVAREERLWSEYHTVAPEAQQAATALKGLLFEFREALGTLPFFAIVNAVAGRLRVAELTKRSSQLLADAYQAQKEKQSLEETLRAQEAWYARSQVVEFAKTPRARKTLRNCAGALAGLPEWGWFHSRRTCEAILDESAPAMPYQLFKLFALILRQMKPLNLEKVEKRLREELLRPEADAMLRGYVTPHWDYLQAAIRECRGKGFKRGEVHYKIMDRFLYHLERTKTAAEVELAKLNQLV